MKDEFDLCLVLNTRMAARAITRKADERLRPYEVTAAQFNILGKLQVRQNRSISDMADDIAMDRTTLSRNLSLLEQKGLVRATHAKAGGARHYEVTEEGKRRFEAVVPIWRQTIAELRTQLTEPDYMTIISGLRAIARL